MKRPVVFFCGDRSPYGLAHLESIAREFELRAIVVPDALRWAQFNEQLCGKIFSFEPVSERARRYLRNVTSLPRRWWNEWRHQVRLRSARAPVLVAHDVNDVSFLSRLNQYQPEIFLSAAFPQIFRAEALQRVPRGAINFHPSLLPEFRGAHPHYWCLAMGAKESGITAHFMTERIDDGDIIAQRSFPLDGLYYRDLYRKLIAETPALVLQVREFLDDAASRARRQNHEKATTFRNDRDIHHRIMWSTMSAEKLRCQIRAGRAHCVFRGHRVYLTRAEIARENRNMTNGVTSEPGMVVDIDEVGMWIAACDGRFLVVNELQTGRFPLPFQKWVERTSINIGEKFG